MHPTERELEMKAVIKFGLGLTASLVGLTILISSALTPPRISVPTSERHVFANVTVYNPGEPIIPNQTIIVDKGLLVDIRPAVSEGGSTLCDGCFVMPGLIDAHVHTPPEIAFGNQELFSLLYLKYGVTTVRDLGQLDDSVPNLKARLNSGKLVGPHMYSCGAILDGDPPFFSSYRVVLNHEAGRNAVQENASNGADCIKVYGNISPDALKGVTEEAKRLGLPLIGHTPRGTSLSDVADFEVQHFTGIPYLDEPAPKDWAYRSQDLIDMTFAEIDDVLAVMVTNNISFLPTNANAMSRLTASDKSRFPASEGFALVPEFWEIAWDSIISHPETEAEIQTDLRAMPFALSFIRKAHDSGVDVLVGTDVIMPYVIPGESMHQQLALMAQALGTPDMALKAATLTNGQHIDKGRVGKVAVGAKASLLFFKNDPRSDLSNIPNWDYLMVEGRLYTRDEIDAAVERYRQHFRGNLYSKIMNIAYGFLAPDTEGSEPFPH